MADKQESTEKNSTQTKQNEIPVVQEPKKVEIVVEGEKNPDSGTPVIGQKQDVLSHLTSEIMEALCFDSSGKTEEELRLHNSQLQSLLGKVIELFKEKIGLCANLEKQNTALALQSNSLKDVVAITKDLLSIRNMEVEHLHVDIKSMEEKINTERERHNNMLNRMSEAVKLNENLKTEYQTQLKLFNDLRSRYEEKVAVLDSENKRLSALVNGGETANQQAIEKAGEGMGEGVQLSLEGFLPPNIN